MTAVGIVKIAMAVMGAKGLNLLGGNIETRKEKNNE